MTLARLRLVGQICAVGLVVSLLVLLIWKVTREEQRAGIAKALSLGEPVDAPHFELPRLDQDGTMSLASLRGKPAVINFWASWCAPCKAEAPALDRFQRANAAGGFTVLGINLDDATDDAVAFVQRYGLTYPQLRDGDGGDRRDAYGMTGFPESFLIDPEGNIALIRRGPVDAEYLDRMVLPMIGSQA